MPRGATPAVFTAGVYGTGQAAFYAALEAVHVDVFLDIRRRRAVRGSQYAFANARRLTHALEVRGISYRHVLDLAPDPGLLALQHAADDANKQRKSQRAELSPAYVRGYERILGRFDFAALAAELEGFHAPVLFCIERIPQACHRSLAAPPLARALGAAEVVHLIPAPAGETGRRQGS